MPTPMGAEYRRACNLDSAQRASPQLLQWRTVADHATFGVKNGQLHSHPQAGYFLS